jgi:hypothetical protein
MRKLLALLTAFPPFVQDSCWPKKRHLWEGD